MTNKWQKYVAIVVMILVGILIVFKLMNRQINWEENDAAALTSACLEDIGGDAVRFHMRSDEYCDCSTQAIMNALEKSEYHFLMSKSTAEQEEELLPVLLDCYNEYQEAIYKESKLD